MRKIISLGLFALFLSILSNSVFAVPVDGKCEILKSKDVTKGLYGLCVAYWNSEGSEGQDQILYLYNERAIGPNDPGMPGLNGCPCWGISELNAACLLPYNGGCDQLDPPMGFASFNGHTVTFNLLSGPCVYVNRADDIQRVAPVDGVQELTCLADIIGLNDNSLCTVN